MVNKCFVLRILLSADLADVAADPIAFVFLVAQFVPSIFIISVIALGALVRKLDVLQCDLFLQRLLLAAPFAFRDILAHLVGHLALDDVQLSVHASC